MAKKKKRGSSVFSSLLKALIYIVVVLGTAMLLSLTIINVGNEVFAFVKNDAVVTITVDENTTLSSLASDLKEAGVIKYEKIFEFNIINFMKNADKIL